MRLPISLLFASVTIAVLSVSVAVLPQQPKAGTASNGSQPGPLVVDGIDRKDYATDVREINLDGLKKILQRDPKDTRPLLINFWATWCDPCREEFPDLVKVDSDYRSKGLNFVAVSLDDITDIKTAVPKFLNEMKATMPVVLLNVNDPDRAIKVVDADLMVAVPQGDVRERLAGRRLVKEGAQRRLDGRIGRHAVIDELVDGVLDGPQRRIDRH